MITSTAIARGILGVVVSLWDVQVYVHDQFGKSVSERRTIIELSAGLGVAGIDCAGFYYSNYGESGLSNTHIIALTLIETGA